MRYFGHRLGGVAGCVRWRKKENTAPEKEAPPAADQTAEPAPVADAYNVQLGERFVTIKKHPVLNGSGNSVVLNIGVGEIAKADMEKISSDDLDAFIAGLDFDSYGYNNIVLEFDDGTGLIFVKGMSGFSNEYGVVDVSKGKFEMIEKLGAIWNDTGEGWYYMTVEEMEAKDAEG